MRCHIAKHALAARAVDERGFPLWNSCAVPLANESAAGAAVSGSAPHTLISGRKRFHGARHAGDQPATADRGNDRDGVRRILENLEAHRRVTGYEVLIVEWMG